ncbi:MAG: sterol desaturase family protein [Candidatus Binataceae bacterium]|jgi:sterol desaturase/sphingolipid hydroxylase (fatty acid hydroxylase superfamily)
MLGKVNRETFIRLGVFAAVLLAMALWEALAPRRTRSFARAVRWPANLGISILDSIVVRMMLPLGAVGFASFCAAHGWGLLNAVAISQHFTLPISVVMLDLVIYLQHVMFHAVPALWRVHRMHHSDLDFDVTTGVRFHPIEIVISMGMKLAAIAALGAPAVAVLAFEVLLNATSMFNHGNVAIPFAADAMVRRLIVTPDMHRVHHSIVVRETNSNFGFNLSWWDRLFGTYRAQPAAGHLGMTIGIEDFREPRELKLGRMLVQPWRGAPGDYPING